jgi:glutathione peroxidase
MTFRQKIMRMLYPLILRLSRLMKRRAAPVSNSKNASPAKSLYDLSIELNNGTTLSFNSMKGKKILLVNTASSCGYTPQYAELQQLYEKNKDRLEVVAFPANDFKEQEKENDAVIASFCKINYGVSFPLAKKNQVIKGGSQQAVFQWLTNKGLNGWNNAAPGWNFYKYLIDEEGKLVAVYPSQVSPLEIQIDRLSEK